MPKVNRGTRPKSVNHRHEKYWATIKNLPSPQIAKVTDRYIELMLEPVALYTDVIHEGIAEALVLLTNHRRKITNQNRDDAITKLFVAMANERETITSVLMALGIERNILLDMIHTALIDDSVFTSDCDPEPLRRHLRVLWDDLATFRTLILHRYDHLIKKQSGSFAWGRRQNGLLVETEDAAQNYAMASIRALDKFDADSGALTTYMGNWLRNASHSIFNLHLGESYAITRGVRSKIHKGEVDYNNHSVQLHDNPIIESITTDEHHGESEYDQTVNALVNILRTNNQIGEYRLALLAIRAHYHLTPDEIELQRHSASAR